jgi:hypothetical protein
LPNVRSADDLSWWETDANDGWVGRDAIPQTTMALLSEIGRTYVPFMLANAQALQSGADETVCQIDGAEYRQGPFAYQGKCLVWLRDQYAALTDIDRRAADSLLGGTGCEPLFT